MSASLQSRRRQPSAAAPPQAVPYRQLCAHCRTLGITRDEVETCPTIGGLQRLAKTQYRELAKRYHPDTQAARLDAGMAAPRLATGHTFRRLAAAYQWLMALAASAPLGRQDPYTLPPSLIPEVALPWSMQRRTMDLGLGWQEVPSDW